MEQVRECDYDIVPIEELENELDREAQARLGMSGAEFEAAYVEGQLEPSLAATELSILLRSIRHARIPA